MLAEVQKSIFVPKGQKNDFGGYNYRSCEDILVAAKAIIPQDASVLLTDEVVVVGDRVYVKATAMFSYGGDVVKAEGWAREPISKKGMDESQITGAASSYARKYALNGLFAIDNTKDADATNKHVKRPEVMGWIESATSVENLTTDILADIKEAGYVDDPAVRSAYAAKGKKLKESN